MSPYDIQCLICLYAESGDDEPTPPSISSLVTTEDVQTIEKATDTDWVGNETTMIGETATIDSEINIALIGAVTGGISGSLLVLLVFFLLLVLVWVIRKRRRCVNETNHLHHQAQIEGNKQVRRVHVELEGESDQSMKMNSNCAYNTSDSLIPTVNNVAYNYLYMISDKYEYDYI